MHLRRAPGLTESDRLAGSPRKHYAKRGVTWVHSYVSEDLGKSFCIYDGPNPEAILDTASMNELPVDKITQVSVLDPYFYRG